jgi:hypothetical protein
MSEAAPATPRETAPPAGITLPDLRPAPRRPDDAEADLLTAVRHRRALLTYASGLMDDAESVGSALADALRDWGRAHYGSADAFYRALSDRAECSWGHASNALRYGIGDVLTHAEALYLEAEGATAPEV